MTSIVFDSLLLQVAGYVVQWATLAKLSIITVFGMTPARSYRRLEKT